MATGSPHLRQAARLHRRAVLTSIDEGGIGLPHTKREKLLGLTLDDAGAIPKQQSRTTLWSAPLPDFGDLYRTPAAVCSALSTTDIWPAAKSMLRHRSAMISPRRSPHMTPTALATASRLPKYRLPAQACVFRWGSTGFNGLARARKLATRSAPALLLQSQAMPRASWRPRSQGRNPRRRAQFL